MFLSYSMLHVSGDVYNFWPPKGYPKRLDSGGDPGNGDPKDGGDDKVVRRLPNHLGMLRSEGFGVVTSCLAGSYAVVTGWDKGRHYVNRTNWTGSGA